MNLRKNAINLTFSITYLFSIEQIHSIAPERLNSSHESLINVNEKLFPEQDYIAALNYSNFSELPHSNAYVQATKSKKKRRKKSGKIALPKYQKNELDYASNRDEEIAQRYILNIGEYLIPAHLKVNVTDWKNPSFNDYWQLQDYLSCDRPELAYLNYPGTTFRQERAQTFCLISQSQPPKFEILYLNNDPSDKKKCIITYVSANEEYIEKQDELIGSIEKSGFDGHIIRRIGGWPATETGSLEYFDVPYAFKIFALLEARNLGYDQCLWIDASWVIVKPADVIFEQIEKQGMLFFYSPTYNLFNHIQPFAAESFATSVEDFLSSPPIFLTMLGIDFTKEIGLNLFNLWHESLISHKLGFLSFIPEQAPLGIILQRWKISMPHYAIDMKYITCVPDQPITSDTIFYRFKL